MFLKTFAIALPVILGGMYVSGSFGGGGWSRDVARPQSEVMRALEDLDIRDQPGSPGTDPSRSGGVAPVFNLERTADSMRWKVMSGDKVAVTMIADFKPSADGNSTHVTAHVERGNAPDDFVSPAFRSKGITLGLFSMALEGELNELTLPAAGNPEACAKLFEQFQEANMEAGAGSRPESLRGAIGQVAATGVRLNAYEAEQRRLGASTATAAAISSRASRWGRRMGRARPPAAMSISRRASRWSIRRHRANVDAKRMSRNIVQEFVQCFAGISATLMTFPTLHRSPPG